MRLSPAYSRLFLFIAVLWGAGYGVLHASGAALERIQKSSINFDSLNSLLNKASDEQHRVQLLNNFSRDFRDWDHGWGMSFANEALNLAEEIGDTGGKMNAHMRLAEIEIAYQHNYDQGLFHLTYARELNGPEKDLALEVRILNLMGFVNHRMGNIGLARQHYDQAILISKENEFDNYGNLLARVGEMLVEEGQVQEGKKYYERVVELEGAEGPNMISPGIKVGIGQYYDLIGEPRKAIAYYRKAVTEFEVMENYRWASYVWSEIAAAENRFGNNKEAVRSGLIGLEMAEHYKLTKETADNHGVLATVYDSLGNPERALHHFRRWTSINEEMFSLEKAKEIARIQSAHEFSLREQELIRAEHEKELELTRSRILAVGSGFGILLIGLMSLLLYRRYRQKKKINLELEDRVELKDMAMMDIVKQLKQEVELHENTQLQLETTHDEFNHFVHQSSHDLRGPLSSILGLVSIAQAEISVGERREYLGLIGRSTEKLRKKLDSLIQVIHLANSEPSPQTFFFQPLLDDLLSQLRERDIAKGVVIESRIKTGLQLESDPHLVKAILGNLLDNAMRYKKSGVYDHRVEVLAGIEKGLFILEVSDNGRGIPEHKQESVFEMFVKSQQDFEGSGLGLFLVKKAVSSLGGEISLDSRDNGGASFRIAFPRRYRET